MKKLTGMMLLLVMILAGAQVFADTVVPFGDSKITWPEYTSSIATDIYGTPDFLGGSATIANGFLTNLTFNIQNPNNSSASLWPLLKPGDLFIDANNDKIWDYVVNLITSDSNGYLVSVTDNINNFNDKNLYKISQPLNGSGYLTSSMAPLNYSVREGQPVGFEGGTAITGSSVIFSGWNSSVAAGNSFSPSFAFGANDILLGSNFSIGWTVNCANDVLYETMNNPVPEPASMLLMGSGLIGLAGWGRRKFSKKEAVEA